MQTFQVYPPLNALETVTEEHHTTSFLVYHVQRLVYADVTYSYWVLYFRMSPALRYQEVLRVNTNEFVELALLFEKIGK